MTSIKVNYSSGGTSYTDAYVILEQYGFWHIEGSGSSWTINVTAADGTYGATLAAVYASRADAVTALNKLATAAGQTIDVGTL